MFYSCDFDFEIDGRIKDRIEQKGPRNISDQS